MSGLLRAGKSDWKVRAPVMRPSRLGRLHFFDHLAEFPESDILNLADTLTGDTKFLTDFFQSLLRPTIEAEAGAQNSGLAGIECFDHLLQHARDGLFLQLLVRRVS